MKRVTTNLGKEGRKNTQTKKELEMEETLKGRVEEEEQNESHHLLEHLGL